MWQMGAEEAAAAADKARVQGPRRSAVETRFTVGEEAVGARRRDSSSCFVVWLRKSRAKG
jgi:hypothetical protein